MTALSGAAERAATVSAEKIPGTHETQKAAGGLWWKPRSTIALDANNDADQPVTFTISNLVAVGTQILRFVAVTASDKATSTSRASPPPLLQVQVSERRPDRATSL